MKLTEYLNQSGRGSKSELARRIGGHASDLSDWIAGKRQVPAHRCTAIELATGGEVTRKDLRPNDWRDYWPELADQTTHQPKHN